MGVRWERAAGQGALVLHADFASPAATSPRVSSELEQARPQTSGEEELQLQLALAMSREVAEQVGASRDARPRGAGPGRTHRDEGLSLVGPGDASVRGASWKRSRALGWAPSQVSTALITECGPQSARWVESIWTQKRMRQRLGGNAQEMRV